MRWLILFVSAVVLAGCAAAPEETTSTMTPTPALTHYGPAPELTNDTWLNTDHPLRLADLRGKVVLLDMWTFG